MANVSTLKSTLSAIPSSASFFADSSASSTGTGRGTGAGARPSAFASRPDYYLQHHEGPVASNQQHTGRASTRKSSLAPSATTNCRTAGGAGALKFRQRTTVPVVQICSRCRCRCGFTKNLDYSNASNEIAKGNCRLVSRNSDGVIYNSLELSKGFLKSWRTGAVSKGKEAASYSLQKSKQIHGQFIEATEAEEGRGDLRLDHNEASETNSRDDGTAYGNGTSTSGASKGRLDYDNLVGRERVVELEEDTRSQQQSEYWGVKPLVEEAEDFQNETGSFWEDGEEENWGNESESAAPSPSSEIKLTNEEITRQDNDERFRLRNGREVYEERAYLVGIDQKGAGGRAAFGIKDSLAELTQLADTAGLVVVGSTYQKLETPNPKTYIGGGKVSELKAAIKAFKVETVIFDDELSPGQARNLEKAFGDDVRVCDRTALILDIFSQRAATREASLQVELAQFEYQLPRLTKMWSHLERQAGGMVKGMGEKQIEVDKRILRTRMAALRKDLDSVRGHRQQYRDRRAAVPIPVISLVGYTNAGKSTFLNRLSGAEVLAEDRLFATLDPTTRRVELPNGKDCLFTDTVGFIQKLPTQLVAAFRATLEEITDSSLMVHMVDISHPMAAQQIGAVERVLAELNVNNIPLLTVWNKIDNATNPEQLRAEAAERDDVVCISALTGEGMSDFYHAVGERIKDSMVWVEAVVPYKRGELVNIIHELGIIDQEDYAEQGTLMRAYVPLALSRQLLPFRKPVSE